MDIINASGMRFSQKLRFRTAEIGFYLADDFCRICRGLILKIAHADQLPISLRKLPKQLCQQHLVQQPVLLHIILHRTAASHAGSYTAVGRGHHPVRQAQFAAVLLPHTAIERFHLRSRFHSQDDFFLTQLCFF